MFELIQRGGPLVWVILLASLTAATVFFERLYHLHRAQIRPQDFLQGILNVLKRNNVVEAVAICEETPGPVARIVRAALLHVDDERAAIREAMVEVGRSEIPRLERRVGVLDVVARLTPLLGLLGTVLSLIEALLRIEQKAPLVHMGDLSGALWRALLATAAGLAVSIPSHAAYHFLIGRVESVLYDMEQVTGEMLIQIDRIRHRRSVTP